MPEFDISDENFRLARDRFIRPLREVGVFCTETAFQLLAAIVQAEVNEYGQEGLNRVQRVADISSEFLAQYCRERYPDNRIDANRLLHLITEIGLFAKFPWGPTRP